MKPAEGTSGLSKIERGLEVAVLVAALGTVPVIAARELGVQGPGIVLLDWAIWAVFAAELVVGIARGTERGLGRPLRPRLLDLGIVVLTFPAVPSLLEVLRVVRLVRAVRIARLARAARVLRGLAVEARGLQALGAVFVRRGLLYLVASAVVLVLTGGALMAVIEPETVQGGVWAGLWWAIRTVLGHGDAAPSSPEGRIVETALILVGVGLVGTLAASIAAYFVGQDEANRLREIDARLERIEALLRDRRGAVEHDPPSGPGGEPSR